MLGWAGIQTKGSMVLGLAVYVGTLSPSYNVSINYKYNNIKQEQLGNNNINNSTSKYCSNNNNGAFTLLCVWSYLIIFYFFTTSHRDRVFP